MIDRELLSILCCPGTRQPLREATDTELNQVRGKVAFDIDGALVREDANIAYVIRNGIPVLILDQGIPLEA
jgi:uncharacterized protein